VKEVVEVEEKEEVVVVEVDEAVIVGLGLRWEWW